MDFKKILDAALLPTAILVVTGLVVSIATIVAEFSFYLLSCIVGLPLAVLQIGIVMAVLGWTGFRATKSGLDLVSSVVAAVLAGAVSGTINAIVSFIVGIVAVSVVFGSDNMAAMGMPESGSMTIALWLVVAIIIAAGFGAGIGLIAGAIGALIGERD